MTTERLDDERGSLAWMRAEFRAAQQRRYETSRDAVVKEVSVAAPKPAPEAAPPSVATPSE